MGQFERTTFFLHLLNVFTFAAHRQVLCFPFGNENAPLLSKHLQPVLHVTGQFRLPALSCLSQRALVFREMNLQVFILFP